MGTVALKLFELGERWSDHGVDFPVVPLTNVQHDNCVHW